MGFRGSEGGVLILVSAARWAIVIGLIGWLASAGGPAVVAQPHSQQPLARAGRAAPREIRRASPPAAVWDKPTALMFSADAFAELEGPRPDFSSQDQRPPTATAMPSSSMAANATGGFAWSAVVSEETLTDEIKDLKATAARAVSSQSEFKGGGYAQAGEAFSTAALAFGVIAAYDQDIRWKREAETARDLFARVGFNCEAGNDESFNEAKLRVGDLESLLEGAAPAARADRNKRDMRWSQVAGRRPLMSRLESADETLAAAVASPTEFDKRLEHVLHDAEIVAVIGEVIQQADYEYHDDDTYRGHASAMRDAALRLREAVKKTDYDAARAALGELRKSCDSCHGAYRG